MNDVDSYLTHLREKQEIDDFVNKGIYPERLNFKYSPPIYLPKMEENEIDLVNKKITEETIRRQREIETRLLEAEESLRERELDQKREGETANPYENIVPKAFEEYFKIKEKEIELLKTVPPKLYPYYKKEVNEYFKRIGER